MAIKDYIDGESEVRQPRMQSAQLIGLTLIFIAFLLPAVRMKTHGAWGEGDGTHFGFACALSAPLTLPEGIIFLFRPESGESRWEILMALSGLINPGLIGFLFATPTWRRYLAVALTIDLASTLIGFSLLGHQPLIGFFLWASGVLLFVSPGFKRTRITTGNSEETEAR